MVVPGDVAGNVDRMAPMIAEAADRGAALALFSECGVTGYDWSNIGVGAAMTLEEAALGRIEALVGRHRIAVVAGLYERSGGELYNTAVAFLPDGRRVVQRKHNIVEHEKEHTPTRPPGRTRTIFEYRGLRWAILIGADGGMPGIHEELAGQGCQVVLAPTASGGNTATAFRQQELTDPLRREAYLKAAESVCFVRGMVEQALRLGLAMASCNQAGWAGRIWKRRGTPSTDPDERSCRIRLLPQVTTPSLRKGYG
jgi:predicted amidohydrolase